jgi:hypothetical protein
MDREMRYEHMMLPAAYPQVNVKPPSINQSSTFRVKALRYLAQNLAITATVARTVKTMVITTVLRPSSVRSFAPIVDIDETCGAGIAEGKEER